MRHWVRRRRRKSSSKDTQELRAQLLKSGTQADETSALCAGQDPIFPCVMECAAEPAVASGK
jgi:hypothetical protein